MAIPARVRDRLASASESQLVLTVHVIDACLMLYPLNEWEALERKLSQLSTANHQNRRWQRLLVGHAFECEMDAQGRILVPPMLRKYAGLEKQVVMIGQVNRLEIWNETSWEQQRETWLQETLEEDTALPPQLEDLAL